MADRFNVLDIGAYELGLLWTTRGGGNGGGATVGASNRAWFIRVTEGWGSILASKIGFIVTAASGNIDLGVYANTGVGRAATPGARRASTGSTVCPANGFRTLPLTLAATVTVGDWLAVAADNNTAAFQRVEDAGTALNATGQMGFAETQFPLPATAAALTFNGRLYCLSAEV